MSIEIKPSMIDQAEKEDREEYSVRPLCPWCSRPWTDGMIKTFEDQCWDGYDSMGTWTSVHGVFDITCSSCEKLIYRKEYHRIY